MENREFSDSIDSQANPEQLELRGRKLVIALSKLNDNGDPGQLRIFIRDYGEQSEKIALDTNRLPLVARYKQNIVETAIRRIETDLKYDIALFYFSLLKKSGAVDQQELQKLIQKRITEMSQYPKYGSDFINDFASDLKEKIKEELGWDIQISV